MGFLCFENILSAAAAQEKASPLSTLPFFLIFMCMVWQSHQQFFYPMFLKSGRNVRKIIGVWSGRNVRKIAMHYGWSTSLYGLEQPGVI